MNRIKHDHLVFGGSIILSLVYVVFLWRFWMYGTQAVGINFAAFYLLAIAFFVIVQRDTLKKTALVWIVPLVMIGMSFFWYATSFTAWISILIFPIVFFLFTTHEAHKNVRDSLWSRFLPLVVLIAGGHYLVSTFGPSRKKIGFMTKRTHAKGLNAKRHIIIQVCIGVVLLVIVSMAFVVPLLSSADASFARIFSHILSYFGDFVTYIVEFFERISLTTLKKMIVFLCGVLFLLGFAVYWQKDMRDVFAQSRRRTLHSYSIAIGVFLVGIIFLYMLFAALQITSLFVSALPTDFAQTESLVKSGFWQLFALTIFNILLYVVIFQKSAPWVQRILMVFTFLSLLLVFSAAQRVYLYVVTYGLSYEKFFAFYTVVYCTIVFLWFLVLFVGREYKVSIVKTLAFVALGMYAFSVVLPLEKMIFMANLHLTQQKDSRVNINEMRMLGFDALPCVEKHFDLLMEQSYADFADHAPTKMLVLESYNRKEEEYLYEAVEARWLDWIEERQVRSHTLMYSYYRYDRDKSDAQEKAWYEKTFTELLYTPRINVDEHFASHQHKKWSNPIHGFALQYHRDLYFNEQDAYDVAELKNSDYTVRIEKEMTDDVLESIDITLYNIDEPHPSQKHANIVRATENAVASEKKIGTSSHRITLPHMPDIPAYIFYKKFGKNKAHYALYIAIPRGVLVIDSSTPHELVSDLSHISFEEYVQLITPYPELADVILSLRLIDTIE